MKTGILLVNLGTPKSPKTSDVRSYLKEFLSDKRVLDLPVWIRKALLYGVILPFRSPKTSEAYQSIWEPRGSPLMRHSQDLAQGLQHALGSDYLVALGMRYGQPSLDKVLSSMLDQVDKLHIIPLYPQYASSTTGSVVEYCFQWLQGQWNIPAVEVLDAFFDKSWYLDALAEHTQTWLDGWRPDHLLLSFHGLPVRHLEKSEAKVCQQTEPCPPMHASNHFCYRAQCYATARGLMQRLSQNYNYTVCFQSRLGRIPWIKPYTDEVLPQLRAQGVQRLAVACPSFVADCLETLEEIGIRLNEQWRSLGGSELQLIPALNSEPVWIRALAKSLLRDQAAISLKKIA